MGELRSPMKVFPRIPCIAFFLAVVVLFGSALGLAKTGSTNSQSAPQSQVGQSQRVQLEGELKIQYQDFKDRARLFYSLKQADGTRVPLQFVKNPPTHLLTGDHVLANGQLSGGSLLLYSGSTSLTKTTAANRKMPPPPP